MKFIRFIVFLILLHGLEVKAQNHDFGVWTGIKVSKSINKKVKTFGEFQARFNQNSTALRSTYLQAGVGYKFAKWYQLGVVYRYSNFNDFSVNRFDINNDFDYKTGKNNLGLRLKYQKSIVTHKIKGDRFRVRLKYSYRINKKIKPYAKMQFFYTHLFDFKGWDQQRYTLGTLVRLKKKNYIDVFFNYEFEYNVANPQKNYVLGLKYKLKYK